MHTFLKKNLKPFIVYIDYVVLLNEMIYYGE